VGIDTGGRADPVGGVARKKRSWICNKQRGGLEKKNALLKEGKKNPNKKKVGFVYRGKWLRNRRGLYVPSGRPRGGRGNETKKGERGFVELIGCIWGKQAKKSSNRQAIARTWGK